MNIPKSVRIGSMVYDVKLTDKIILKGTQQCYGHIDWEQHVIEVDEKLQDIQGLEHTFLHELFHGIIHEHHIKLEDDEETFVDNIALGLHQIIKDNPEIFIKKD